MSDIEYQQALNDSLTYYDKISNMTADELSKQWEEETEEEYEYGLEVLPPIRWKGNAFMVGECICDWEKGKGDLYYAHTQVENRYFFRPAPLLEFNPGKYVSEIRSLFYENIG